MTDEDALAAKLKGYTVLVKFKDGEELFLKVPDVSGSDDDAYWFQDVEKFINGCSEDTVEYFPASGISMTRGTIKYVIKL